MRLKLLRVILIILVMFIVGVTALVYQAATNTGQTDKTAKDAVDALPGLSDIKGSDLKPDVLDSLKNIKSRDYDYVKHLGVALVDQSELKPGEFKYCPLDNLKRPTCAKALLTHSLYLAEKKQPREPKLPDPTGWPKNFKATIPALGNVAHSRSYRGWFWNRSHMIADSLGGAPVKENLLTATRMQNVGSTPYVPHKLFSGGMAYSEWKAREYLSSQKDDSCPLYYAVTPKYKSHEIIARFSYVDIKSCDGKLNERLIVNNDANGFKINYSNGSVQAK